MSKSPFKEKSKFISEINNFLSRYGRTLAQPVSKISAYFEIACCNYIVRYYENSGFLAQVKNLDKTGNFRYKLGPKGYPRNFSYFTVSKTYNHGKNPKTFQYDIRHNIPVQSSHDNNVFITPDIVICEGGLENQNNPLYYYGMREYHYIPNKSLVSFAEAKHYNPSPEMVVNFIGLVNELMPRLLKKPLIHGRPAHIAPSLIISGAAGWHVRTIKDSLRKRYSVNVFFGVFHYYSKIYSKNGRSDITTI